MKASELIEHLGKLVEDNGDLSVILDGEDDGDYCYLEKDMIDIWFAFEIEKSVIAISLPLKFTMKCVVFMLAFGKKPTH